MSKWIVLVGSAVFLIIILFPGTIGNLLHKQFDRHQLAEGEEQLLPIDEQIICAFIG